MARLSDPSSSSVVVAPEASRGHLLLVEDNTEIQLIASRILTRFGYEVSIAGNGIEALEALATATYDAVLMDGQMPKMDGCTATREIRRREGTERHTPVIAMTANAMDSDREEFLAAGMDDFLTKPIRPDALADALARWVQRNEAASPAPLRAPTPIARPVVAEVADTSELDRERLAILRDLDDGEGGLLAELVDEFIAETERQVDVLRAAVKVGDTHTVEGAAHSLKGSGSNLGATHLSNLASALELDARSGTLGDAGPRIEAIAGELRAARVALEAEVLAA